MKKIQKHIEIVSSSNTHLSSMSKKSRDAVRKVLSKHYSKVGITLVDTFDDLCRLKDSAPDLVFLGMKYIPSQDNKVWLAKFFDEHGIAYTGSSYLAHKLELNKHLAKMEVMKAGLATSPYIVVSQNTNRAEYTEGMHYPLFVKPTDLGGGVGIDADSVVYSSEELDLKVASIARLHGSDSLVERYLSGREFSVALLRNEHTNELVVMPIELSVDPGQVGKQVISAAAKSANNEVVTCLDSGAVKASVCNLARGAFYALGGRDYGRIDIRTDENGVPHFLEANLLPSLIEGYGSFPKACLINEHMEYESMMLHIVRLGLQRAEIAVKPGFELSAQNTYAFTS